MASSAGSPRDPAAERRKALSARVAWTGPAADVAVVPGRILVRGEAARRVRTAPGFVELPAFDERDDDEGDPWLHAEVENSLELVEVFRADGLQAQPEHVFFAHGCDPCVMSPHPALAYGFLEPAPYKGNPYKGNPYKGNPYKGNPYKGNPYKGNPYRANEGRSSAMPAAGRQFPVRSLAGPGHPHIRVLDTGLAGPTPGTGTSATTVDQLPPLFAADTSGTQRVTGTLDRPDSVIVIDASTSYAPDGWLDPVAGHGTFIAGLIEQLAPRCVIRVENVMGPLGDVREVDVIRKIDKATGDARASAKIQPHIPRPEILSMSFGGNVLGSAPAFRSAVARARAAGITVVASAGNDGSPLPQYPAAFDHVVAVGAVGPDGPAPWTNYGSWVDACAPGVDLVSAFFARFDGPEPIVNGMDPDRFGAWATWSGTSFSAPVVVAALAREMVVGHCTAAVAVERVIRAPHLLRIPCLGTVVNV